MPLARILVVEDDAAIRRGVVDTLGFGGYDVVDAADGEAGLRAADGADIDLALLDILMPKMNGMDLLQALRARRPALPVIFLTARGEEEDRVRGLRLGADDYVVKPFGARELLARVEAVLRRSAERPQAVHVIQVAGRTVDFERRELRFDGVRMTLSEREAELLCYLARNPGRAISREELLQRVWGVDPRGMHTRTVDMAVARLREQLRDDPAAPSVVLTVRGKGYMLATDGPGPHDPPRDPSHAPEPTA